MTDVMDLVKAKLTEKKITQTVTAKKLTKALGVTCYQSGLSKRFQKSNGDNEFTIAELIAFAKILGIKPSELLKEFEIVRKNERKVERVSKKSKVGVK